MRNSFINLRTIALCVEWLSFGSWSNLVSFDTPWFIQEPWIIEDILIFLPINLWTISYYTFLCSWSESWSNLVSFDAPWTMNHGWNEGVLIFYSLILIFELSCYMFQWIWYESWSNLVGFDTSWFIQEHKSLKGYERILIFYILYFELCVQVIIIW